MYALATQSKSNSDISKFSVEKPASRGNVVPAQTPLWAHAALPIQTSLKINVPGDSYEQEAERVAKQVMHMPEPQVQRQVVREEEKEGEMLSMKPLSAQITPLVQRSTLIEEEDDELFHAKGEATQPPSVSSSIEADIQSLRQSGGQPLDPATRAFMESRFGYDFGQVRVHNGARADAAAQAVNAQAYTIGCHVGFGTGKYAPQTMSGQKLLAHELVHTIQQTAHEAPSATGLLLQKKPKDATRREERQERRTKRREERQERRTKRREERQKRRATRQEKRSVYFDDTEPILIKAGPEGLAAHLALKSARTMANQVEGKLKTGTFPHDLYYNRFGRPKVIDAEEFAVYISGREDGYVDRITGDVYATLDEATKNEMAALSKKFYKIVLFLHSKDLDFLFPEVEESVTIGDCKTTKCRGGFAWICAPSEIIVICPKFFPLSTKQQGGILIHEAAHLVFGSRHEWVSPAGIFDQRIGEAACFSSLAAELFEFEPADPHCPRIPVRTQHL